MKNRIWNQPVKLVAAGILFTMAVCGKWGQTAEIRASNVDSEGLKLIQTARWMEEEPWKAEISMDVHGLLAYRDKKFQESQGTGESDMPSSGENVSDVTEENVEAAQEISWEEEWEDFETDTQEASENEYGYQEEADVFYESVSEENGVVTEEYTAEEMGESVFEEGYEEAPEGGSNNSSEQLFLENYISEYFVPIIETIPERGWIEEVKAVNQKGEETLLYKIVYPIHLSEVTEDTLNIKIQAMLREEYRYPSEKLLYPLSQDEPLKKDCPGPGFRITETKGVECMVLAQEAAAYLEVGEANVDFDVNLKIRTPEVKAGSTCSYELVVHNTGDIPLKDMKIKSLFEKGWKEEIEAIWDEMEGISIQGKEAIIPFLGKGESRSLFMSVKLGEEAQGRFVYKILAEAPCPKIEGEKIGKEVKSESMIEPLKADFTVEKTADRTQAYPGDTITYQICIRNTGERTLHSVLSTERFLGAGVQARFQPKEGVTLNASGTQALIEKIAPGEAFALQAVVTLPQSMISGELINQVEVVSKETGSKNYQSQSKIQVAQILATPTPVPYNNYQVDYQSGSLGKSAYMATTQPKTGDNTEIVIFLALFGAALVSGAGAFWLMKSRGND